MVVKKTSREAATLPRLTRADERVVSLSGFRPPQWHYGINWLA